MKTDMHGGTSRQVKKHVLCIICLELEMDNVSFRSHHTTIYHNNIREE